MPLAPVPSGSVAYGSDTLLASAARTATGTSDFVNLDGPTSGMVIQIDVTAVAGTSPTLTIDLQDTVDGAGYNKVVTLTPSNITATGRVVYRLDCRANPITNRVRLAWTIGGTSPSFTFDVKAISVRV